MAERSRISQEAASSRTRKRGLKPAKRLRDGSGAKLAFSIPERGERSGYALGAKFFVFSFTVLFLFFWFLLGSRLALYVVLPALVLAFGAATLLYALFSLVGWAKPLIELVGLYPE
ncbi:MAG: hypothetical protein V1817_02580 [Candidatus Micrarchaeota archaeon]